MQFPDRVAAPDDPGEILTILSIDFHEWNAPALKLEHRVHADGNIAHCLNPLVEVMSEDHPGPLAASAIGGLFAAWIPGGRGE